MHVGSDHHAFKFLTELISSQMGYVALSYTESKNASMNPRFEIIIKTYLQ